MVVESTVESSRCRLSGVLLATGSLRVLERVRDRVLGLFDLIAQIHTHATTTPSTGLILTLRLFYGCSYRFHLSGDNSRDRYVI